MGKLLLILLPSGATTTSLIHGPGWVAASYADSWRAWCLICKITKMIRLHNLPLLDNLSTVLSWEEESWMYEELPLWLKIRNVMMWKCSDMDRIQWEWTVQRQEMDFLNWLLTSKQFLHERSYETNRGWSVILFKSNLLIHGSAIWKIHKQSRQIKVYEINN